MGRTLSNLRSGSAKPWRTTATKSPLPNLSGLRVVSAFGERRLVGPPSARRVFGVPPGGPFDRLSAALANALVGLSDETPIWEIALGPVVLEATAATAIGVVGGPDGAYALAPGERMEIRPVGARAYVAVGTGPTRRLADPPRPGGGPLRVVSGPQADLLPPLAGEYRVGLASNRVGLRLEGGEAPHALSLLSEPAVPGAIQVPPDGQPIVLGPDGPTIGGYPKVAVVIGADLDRLARLRPGDAVRFETIGLDAARAAFEWARGERMRRTAELRATL